MSDTPRTDRAQRLGNAPAQWPDVNEQWVTATFARALERELAASREYARRLKEFADGMADCNGLYALETCIAAYCKFIAARGEAYVQRTSDSMNVGNPGGPLPDHMTKKERFVKYPFRYCTLCGSAEEVAHGTTRCPGCGAKYVCTCASINGTLHDIQVGLVHPANELQGKSGHVPGCAIYDPPETLNEEGVVR